MLQSKVLEEIEEQRGKIMFPEARDCRMLLRALF